MEIVKQQHERESAELSIRGRLDGSWADHLSTELERLVHEGTHRLWLDLSEVTYLSSRGIGILLRYNKQLKGLGGTLKIVQLSVAVREVLEVSQLIPILVGEPPNQPGRRPATWLQRAPRRGLSRAHPRATFEIFEYPAEEPLRCRAIGDSSLLQGCRFRESDCRPVPLSADAFALGLGALGRSFNDCRDRFGEFLAVAGFAAYLPTEGGQVPDYLHLGAATASNVRLCYGLVYEGPFSRLLRFETKRESGPLGLADLVRACLDLCAADAIGLVVVAESAGLMGASLRRSPALEAPADAPFTHPGIRDWLTFTSERAYRGSTVLVAGVALRREPGSLAPLVRPMGREPLPAGHFHAAAFSSRVLSMGEIDLKETVAGLFENQNLQGILHLLGDFRGPVGLGESEFVRGACWVGPLETERAVG
jgi:anti-anti-sigma factor